MVVRVRAGWAGLGESQALLIELHLGSLTTLHNDSVAAVAARDSVLVFGVSYTGGGIQVRSYFLALLFLGWGASGYAVTLDFEAGAGVSAFLIGPGNDYEEDGFIVSNADLVNQVLVEDAGAVRSFCCMNGSGSGTESLFWGTIGTDLGVSTVSLRELNGSAFSLTQIDAASASSASGVLNLTGYLEGGGTVTQSLDLTWDIATVSIAGMSGVTQVDFWFDSAISPAPFEIDNIVVTAVPIPAAVWLFASALAGLGLMKRRQV